jgi:probable HAF family extracellular repeat protein
MPLEKWQGETKMRQTSFFEISFRLLVVIALLAGAANAQIRGGRLLDPKESGEAQALSKSPTPGQSLTGVEKKLTTGNASDSPVNNRPRVSKAKIDAAIAAGTTIPTWSDTFTYQGLDFTYRMVGTDPEKGSQTTVIPTVIVPLRFEFADGNVFDASTDIVDGQTPVQGIVNSPLFQNYNFVFGGTSIGNTQFADAFQRANFWNSVSTRARDYHVLLSPTVTQVQTITLPDGKFFYYTDPDSGDVFPVVDAGFFESQRDLMFDALNISTGSLPIFVTGRALPQSFAYHFTLPRQGSIQTGLVTFYGFQNTHAEGVPLADIAGLSHELIEWLDDPFSNNYTPGWDFVNSTNARCGSTVVNDTLETADTIEFDTASYVAFNTGSFTYHLADSAFIDFFTRNDRSRSVNGQYDLFAHTNGPSANCVGHVEFSQTETIDVPDSLFTAARGINNSGDVVGYFIDPLGQRHGFLFDGRSYTTLNHPVARYLVPEKINNSGQIVGYYRARPSGTHGFSLKNNTFTPIDFPGAIATSALGLNDRGDIVGSYFDADFTQHGFVLTSGKFQTVNVPFGSQNEIDGINDLGELTGYAFSDYYLGPYFGFARTSNGYSHEDFPEAQFTFPSAINISEMLVGSFQDSNGNGDGFAKIFGHMHEVNVAVNGNNDLNQIVGTTYDSNLGKNVGFIGTLPIHGGTP